MSLKDLREYVALLEQKGELKTVQAEVDPELEITEITDRISKANGPALLFSNVKGSKFPVLINAFGSMDRMAWSLSANNLDEIAARISRLLDLDSAGSFGGKIDKLKDLYKLSKIMPKTVKTAPCQEVVQTDDLNLGDYPVLKCWPDDGGRFITLPQVITKDPETGKQNVGMYRLQVFDERTTGMHWHTHHDGAINYRKNVKLGQNTEVAVALGGDPAITYSATAPLPYEIGEYLFAGFLRDEPVELARAKTVDLMVPAHAEIVLEGYVDKEERRREGPFGDHTGYYSTADDYPVFHLTAITRRNDAIYPATVVGKPPQEDCYMGKATERIFLPLIKFQLPEIVDLNLPLEGVFHNCALVSIKKQYPMHARKVINAIWGLGQMMFTKFIVIVDEDVDVQNASEVAWKVFNNVDPKRDTVLTEGPLDVLDHASNTPIFGAKMGIDATKKLPEEGYGREWPDDIAMSEEVKKLVDQRWTEYGLS
jgi:4-hydroxy-3-polyprenylbenzoate decarboxylase